MSERYERTCKRMTEWPSAYVSIHDCSKPQSILSPIVSLRVCLSLLLCLWLNLNLANANAKIPGIWNEQGNPEPSTDRQPDGQTDRETD